MSSVVDENTGNSQKIMDSVDSDSENVVKSNRRASSSSKRSYSELHSKSNDDEEDSDEENGRLKEARTDGSGEDMEAEEEEDEDDEDEEYVSKKSKSKNGKAKAKRSSAATPTNGKVEASKVKRKRSGKSYAEEDESDGAEHDGLIESDAEVSDEESDLDKIIDAAGGIVYIEVTDFMNHKKMHVALNKNLNFITGKNGSGKSAVVTALMICLGSKASSTGRGSSLKELIRHGSNGPAIAHVCLRNTGPDAFEPEKYGNKIIVERKIVKTASGSSAPFRLLNARTKECHSKSRRDVDKLLGQLNIQVENPTCILTQEMSKKFIQGSEQDKYDFFKTATGLRQMSEELLVANQNCSDARDHFEKATVKLEPLKIDVANKKEDFQKCLEIDRKGSVIHMCHAKMLWVEVEDARTKLEEFENVERDLANRLATKETELQKLVDSNAKQLNMEELTARIETLHKGIISVDGKLQETMKKQSSNKAEAKKLDNRIRKEKGILSDLEKKLVDVDAELKDKKEKLLNSTEGEEAVLLKEEQEQEASIRDMQSETNALQSEKNSITDALKELKSRRQAVDTDLNQKERHIKELEMNLRDLQKDSGGDNFQRKLRVLGNEGMVKVVNAIQRDRDLKENIIGPIGSLYKLREGFEKFEEPVKVAIGSVECTFLNIGGNPNHTNKVHDLLKQFDCRFPREVVRVGRSAPHRIVRFPPGHTTILDCIAIEEGLGRDAVFNFLVDRLGIERTLALEKATDIENFRRADGKDYFAISDIKDALCIEKNTRCGFREGTRFNNMQGHIRTKNYLFKDSTSLIQAAKDEILEAKRERQEFLHTAPNFDIEKRELDSKILQVDKSLKLLTKNIRNAKSEMSNIREHLNDLGDNRTADTSFLEQEKIEIIETIETSKRTIESLSSNTGTLSDKITTLDNEKNAFDIEKEKLQAEVKQIEDDMQSVITEENKMKRKIHSLERDISQSKIELQKSSEVKEKENQKFEAFQVTAMTETSKWVSDWDGQPIPIDRKDTRESLMKTAKKEQDTINKMKEDKNVAGMTSTQAQERYLSAKNVFKSEKASLDILEQNMDTLTADLRHRSRAYKEHRMNNEKAINKAFKRHLEAKSFTGHIEFEHEVLVADHPKRGLMSLKVSTGKGDKEDEVLTNVKQMSGGERSFVTLALLLALGKVQDSPFRIMDEYDVFLDELSRVQTLGAIQKTAVQASNAHRQFIIITPHNLKDIKTGPKTKIHKMADPERRKRTDLTQTTLDVERSAV